MVDAVMSPGAASDGAPKTTGAGALGAWLFNPLARVPRVNIMLVGSDDKLVASGVTEKGRADTLMVLCLSPVNKRAALFSIPRDFLVHLPGIPHVQEYPQKINHAYAYGHIPMVKRTVERELGLRIDHYVKIDLASFVKVVDMLGGVDLTVPDVEGSGRGMNYDDDWGNLHVNLKPGYQHLDGKQAMGFVRYRKSVYHTRKGGWLGLTDMERDDNQQTFLQAMLEQKVKVSNAPGLIRAAAFIMQHVDTDMDWRTSVGLLQVFRSLDSTQGMLRVVLPVEDRMMGGIYYCSASPEKILEEKIKIDAFLAGTLAAPQPTTSRGGSAAPAPQRPVRVQILNGSGTPGRAKRAADTLRGAAVYVVGTGNATSFANRQTVIEYGPGLQASAQRLAERLGLSNARLEQKKAPPGPSAPDVVITIGKDFTF